MRTVANPTGPAAHAAHDLSLADRIVDNLVGEYIRTGCDIARAATGDSTPEEVAAQKAIDQVQHLHLAGWDYRLTPRILDALRRANLLRDPEQTA